MDEVVNVNVRVEDGILITDSLNVAEVFRKRHDHVLRDIENLKKDLPNFGEMFFERTSEDSYGRQRKVYYMTDTGFSLLAMGFTGSSAMVWKLKYIEAFDKLKKFYESPEQVMARALKIADKTINSLKMENKQLTIQNKELTIDNERMKPKEEFFDTVTESKDALPMDQVAKILDFGIGRNTLFKFLRWEKILQKNNVPYQAHVDAGHFRIIEQKFDRGYGDIDINIKTLVFQKGVDYIRKKWKEDGDVFMKLPKKIKNEL